MPRRTIVDSVFDTLCTSSHVHHSEPVVAVQCLQTCFASSAAGHPLFRPAYDSRTLIGAFPSQQLNPEELMSSVYRLRFSMPAAVLLGFSMAAPAHSMHAQATPAVAIPQQDRVAAHPNFEPLVQMQGQLPAWAVPSRQHGSTSFDLSTPIQVALVLRRDTQVEAAFRQLLEDQQNPGSPSFHHWLTPVQVGELYGPTAHDLAAVQAWLTSQGLHIDAVSPSGIIVRASGTAATVGSAFRTSFAYFSPNPGSASAPRLSVVTEPSIPEAIAPVVLSIHGLSQTAVVPLHHARAVQRPLTTNNAPLDQASPLLTLNDGQHFLSPGDFAIIYDLNSVYSGGNQGATIGTKAQHVAIVGESEVAAADISQFESTTGLPSVTPTVVVPTGTTNPGLTQTSLQDEATLDVDRVIATAPGAGVDLVIAKSTATEDGIFYAAEYNVNTLLDPVMSISFGGCEAQAGLGGVNFVDSFASTGAAEGITILASSGDSGAAGCDTSFQAAPMTQVASINFICSSTYVTCVGGTEFNDTTSTSYWSSTNTTTLISAVSYIPEGAWNEPASVNNGTTSYIVASTGGGASKLVQKPSWQAGTGVPADGFRDVPDISFAAASHDGYYACLAYAGGNCAANAFEDFSGTSAGAPGLAGVVALLNQQLGSAQGNINPLLYKLAASTPAAFHDATPASSGVASCSTATPSMCNNSTPAPAALTGGLAGYSLTTAYDLATGLGSLDVQQFLTAAGSAPVLVSTSLSLSAQQNPLAVGGSTTFTATLTPAAGSTGTPGGTVQFYINGVAIGGAVALSANNATSASQTFSTAGTYAITAIYSGDPAFATSTATSLSLVVNAAAAGSFTLAANPVSLAITPTGSVATTGTSTITGTATNGFVGAVALTCAVAPVTSFPPTCALAPANLSFAAGGATSSILTIDTLAPLSGCNTAALAPVSFGRAGELALASVLLLLLPARRRRSFRFLALLLLAGTALLPLNGCGGSSSPTNPPCSAVVRAGTTPGAYTVTVTGTSGTLSQTATVALTVN